MTVLDVSKSAAPSRAKLEGIHYTPERLAEFVAERLLEHAALPVGRPVRVLDPACGDGALLLALASALVARGVDAELTGSDIDAHAIDVAERRLGETPDTITFRGLKQDFTEAIVLKDRDALPAFDEPLDEYEYDLIIANPPYVRTQHLGAKRSQELGRRFGLSGRVDLYQAFIAGFSEVLALGGSFGLIVPNRFLVTRGGESTRRLLAQSFEINEIIDLGDTKQFPAAVLPALVFAMRTGAPSAAAALSSIYSSSTGDEGIAVGSIYDALARSESGTYDVGVERWKVSVGSVDLTGRSDFAAPWVNSFEADNLMARVDAHTTRRFSTLGTIKVGVKTTADKVFIRRDWAQVAPESRPEAELIFPLVSSESVRRWSCSHSNQSILYPYDMTSMKRRPLDLAEHPGAKSYLEAHREVLAGRTYVVEGGREWWEIWVPQKPAAWAGLKIVFPDISVEGRFAIDRSGALVNGNCYWIPIEPEHEDLAYLAVAVANSTLVLRYYDARFGNKLYAGRRRFISQYVSEFPLPDAGDPESQRAIQLARRLEIETDPVLAVELEREADVAVWSAFGVEEA